MDSMRINYDRRLSELYFYVKLNPYLISLEI